MKRLAYFLTIVIIANIFFSSCQRKAITQEEINEFSQKINTELAELNKNAKDSITTAIPDSSSSDSVVIITPDETAKIANISIHQSNNDAGFWIVLIVFIAFLIPFASLVLIIFFALRAITSRQRERNKLIEIAIKSNYPLPDNFFSNPQTSRTRLQSALVWLACGIGTIAFFLVIFDDALYAIGIIPLLIGIAKLITYFVEDRKN